MTQKQIDKEKWFRMNVYCNLAVVTTEVVSSLARDAQGYADYFHKQFRQADKQRMRRVSENLRNVVRDIRYFLTQDLYDLDPDGDKILADADLLDRVVRLFVDRAGVDPQTTKRILAYIERQPSRVGLFKELTRTEEKNTEQKEPTK